MLSNLALDVLTQLFLLGFTFIPFHVLLEKEYDLKKAVTKEIMHTGNSSVTSVSYGNNIFFKKVITFQ